MTDQALCEVPACGPTTTARTTATTPFPWPAILALTGGTFLTVTAEMLPAGLLLDIAADLGVSSGAVGLLVTVWGLAIAVVSLPLARATSRLDQRVLLAGSLAVTGTATVLTALAPSYPLLVGARLLAAAAHGLFWALVVVAGTSLVRPGQVERAVAVMVAGPTVAAVVAIPAATALGEAVGWRVAFGLVGLLTVVGGALVVAALPAMAPPPRPEPARRDASVRRVVTVALLGALLLVAHFLAYTFVAPLLTGPGGLSRGQVSLALLVFGSTGVLGLVAAPWLVRRVPAASLPISGAGLALALLAVRASGGTDALVLAAVGAWGVVIGALPVVFQTRLLALASERFRPTAGAVIVVAFNLGVASGGAAGSGLHDVYGAGPLPLFGAVLAMVAAAALAVVGRVGRRRSRG